MFGRRLAMGHSTCPYLLLLLLLWLAAGCEADFETTRRVHSDFDPNPINMESGWGATKCIDFQEVTTLFRRKTFEPALIVTCEMKSHQCISIRAVNSTHYYTFQGCVPQARVPKMCTEMALESAQKNGAEYFYCYDVDHGRLNVPENTPLDGRECCCNADFCNRMENVRTMVSIIPHDEILNPWWRMWHRYYQNVNRLIGVVSFIALVIFSAMTLWIICRPAQRDDDSAWYAAPVARNQLMDDIAEAEEDEDFDAPPDALATKGPAEIEASNKKKKDKKKGRGTKETAEGTAHDFIVDRTQDISEEQEKTGQDDEFDKKQEKGAAPAKKGSKEGEETEKEKKPAADTTPIDANEKKTHADEAPKKEEKKEEEGQLFKLPTKPKKLANGRTAYISMFNENSDYDDE